MKHNPNPQLTIEFLANFVDTCHYMNGSKDYFKRLNYRMAKELLSYKTREALGGKAEKKTWTKKMEDKR